MRFPKLSELDRDQAKIYQGAPSDGTILILGPPGTGKTVIAFHRAEVLSKKGQSPRVIMYNKVLSRYTAERSNVANNVETSTFHKWVYGWWPKFIHSRAAKPPTIVGNPYDFDWAAIQTKAIGLIADLNTAGRSNWGHLIIDEGQDLPEQMYCALNLIMALGNSHGLNPSMAITVLADENQRLSAGKNSTINQIRTSLGLSAEDKNVFHLRKNYRNTLPIARFASHFYVGLASGQPDFPARTGTAPVISRADCDTDKKNLNAFVQKIVRYASINSAMEIGVFAPNSKIKNSLVNRLNSQLSNTKIKVQSYQSDDEEQAAEKLCFDTPGHITVLNYQSVKGLEFDAVFIIDPSKLYRSGSSELEIKMALYVMCSRARSYLNLMIVKDNTSSDIMQFLPSAEGNYVIEDL